MDSPKQNIFMGRYMYTHFQVYHPEREFYMLFLSRISVEQKFKHLRFRHSGIDNPAAIGVEGVYIGTCARR